jgi:hypothetical protein
VLLADEPEEPEEELEPRSSTGRVDSVDPNAAIVLVWVGNLRVRWSRRAAAEWAVTEWDNIICAFTGCSCQRRRRFTGCWFHCTPRLIPN